MPSAAPPNRTIVLVPEGGVPKREDVDPSVAVEVGQADGLVGSRRSEHSKWKLRSLRSRRQEAPTARSAKR